MVERHVEAGRGGRAALIDGSPVTASQRTFTHAQPRWEVAPFAGVLAGLRVGRGDRVVIYMPMVPEAVIAILAKHTPARGVATERHTQFLHVSELAVPRSQPTSAEKVMFPRWRIRLVLPLDVQIDSLM
jgi:acyl-CoA synthetase (AMP-forming)/AMP-acid ligase II